LFYPPCYALESGADECAMIRFVRFAGQTAMLRLVTQIVADVADQPMADLRLD